MKQLIEKEQQILQKRSAELINLISKATESSCAITPQKKRYNYFAIVPEGVTFLLNEIIKSQNEIARLMDYYYPVKTGIQQQKETA